MKNAQADVLGLQRQDVKSVLLVGRLNINKMCFMKLIAKAYRAIFTWCDLPVYHGQLIHAASAGKARYQYWLSSECDQEDILQIKVRRDPMFDLMENTSDPIVPLLTREQLGNMGHAIGQDWHSKEPYRNRFIMYGLAKDEGFECLVGLGLAESWCRMDTQCYSLTKRGIDVIKSTQPIYRKDLQLCKSK